MPFLSVSLQLTSPVVNAWRVLDGELEQVDLFSMSSVPALKLDTSLPNSNHEVSP